MTYCYGYMLSCSDSDHPLWLKSTSDGNTFTYDANGNIAGGAGRSYTWNWDNRLDTVTGPGGSAVMTYDYTGIRIIKNGASGTTYFPFTGYEVQGGTVTKFIRIGNEIIASKQGTSTKRFYHNDHLGSVNIISNESGYQVQLTEYDPWGKISRSEGLADPTHRFTSQELDSESNIHYYGGRYYDQNLGRFISPDPFVQDPDDPQNLNRYAYVLNGPPNYIDPSGYFSFRDFFQKFMFFTGIISGVINSFEAIAAERLADMNAQFEANIIEFNRQQEIIYNLRYGGCEDCSIPRPILRPLPVGTGASNANFYGSSAFVAAASLWDDGPGVGDARARAAQQRVIQDREAAGRAFWERAQSMGGRAPVLKGQQGVAKSIAAAVARGERVIGREITIRTQFGLRVKLDILTEDAQGNLKFIESKCGPTACLNPNQRLGYPEIRTSGGIRAGQNAAGAGLKPGQPIDPTPVQEDYWP